MQLNPYLVYNGDCEAALKFYQSILRLRQIGSMTGRGLAFRVNESSVLLVFDPAKTAVPDAGVPVHGATGPGHAAFQVPPGGLDTWREHLASNDVHIEMQVAWPLGGRSIYVRDPAGNSIEFIDGRVWPD